METKARIAETCEWFIKHPRAALDQSKCFECGLTFNTHPKSVARRDELSALASAKGDQSVAERRWVVRYKSSSYYGRMGRIAVLPRRQRTGFCARRGRRNYRQGIHRLPVSQMK